MLIGILPRIIIGTLEAYLFLENQASAGCVNMKPPQYYYRKHIINQGSAGCVNDASGDLLSWLNQDSTKR